VAEPYIDSRSSKEKTAAWWQFARAVHFRFLVNQHVQAYVRCHNVAGVEVTPQVMQLLPWGSQIMQFITIDLSSIKAIAKSLGIWAATMDVPELGKLALNGEINEVKEVVERDCDWRGR
jgi:hypothetical protein